MHSYRKRLTSLSFLLLLFVFLSGLSSLDYTRKVEPLPNMPQGNPDPSLGIVVRANSTGREVVADSSQNIRFIASKNFEKTDIERLSSSSMIDYTPKKFKFLDGKHSFSSDNIYEFVILFNDKNHQWKYMRFMPFPSVIEWVTEEKLRRYLDKWVKTFEEAGWKRVEYPKSNNPLHMQNFTLPTREHNNYHQYCSWTTDNYEAAIRVTLRDLSDYKYYTPKEQRKNLKKSLDGYIAIIFINKK